MCEVSRYWSEAKLHPLALGLYEGELKAIVTVDIPS